MPQPVINILVSTIGRRISLVPSLLIEPVSGLSYIISWQTDGGLPLPEALALRDDVSVYTISGHGLSRNRNNAIAHAHADLLILADDDIRLNREWIDDLRTLSLAHKQTDLFVLQAFTPDGKQLHPYPARPFVYPEVPKGFYFNSMGMVLRGDKHWPPFDTRFGLGSERLGMGEEDIFINDCHKEGLTIAYYPQPLLYTQSVTTSSNYNTGPGLQMSKGAVLTVIHGPLLALPRIMMTAWRMKKSIPPIRHLLNMLKGMTYILKTSKTRR